MSEGVLNARPQVIIIDVDTDGSTIIDVLQSVAPGYDALTDTYCEKNNIQAATSMQFESLSVHRNGGHASHIKSMNMKLLSRLKAYN